MHDGMIFCPFVPRKIKVQNNYSPRIWIGVVVVNDYIRWPKVSMKNALR